MRGLVAGVGVGAGRIRIHGTHQSQPLLGSDTAGVCWSTANAASSQRINTGTPWYSSFFYLAAMLIFFVFTRARLYF